jgi:hypothetical protein
MFSPLCSRWCRPKKRAVSIDPERQWAEFFGIALDYYIAGRYAVFAKLHYMAGNLLHHAVEMSLKGALSKGGLDLSELERFRHDLKKLWKAFKKQVSDPKLSTLDAAISKLHRLEKLRYPDFVLEHGIAYAISLKKSTPTTIKGRPEPKEPKFELTLEEVDEIFAAVYTVRGPNLNAILPRLSKEAKELLAWENGWKIV